ncbi:hypothetical protein DPMN_108891 [Dreissena polymorpha]|uniref:Uncharacterized protein n=1 Tax=Dreissena polymorpha TaxID=45954 RepID=A0A9D4K9A9_DREPO|nr:hypothetical protein DPMN_108891 [Dreissena polymorpha]
MEFHLTISIRFHSRSTDRVGWTGGKVEPDVGWTGVKVEPDVRWTGGKVEPDVRY